MQASVAGYTRVRESARRAQPVPLARERGAGARGPVNCPTCKAFEAHRNRPWWRRALRWLNFRARARSKRRAEYIADRIYGRAPSIMIWKSKEDQ